MSLFWLIHWQEKTIYHSYRWSSPICILYNVVIIACNVIGHLCTLFERELVQSLWQIVWRYLKILRIELPYELILWLFILNLQKHDIERYLYPDVYWSLVHSRQNMGTIYVLVDRGVDKVDEGYTYNGILCSYKKMRH